MTFEAVIDYLTVLSLLPCYMDDGVSSVGKFTVRVNYDAIRGDKDRLFRHLH
jgi:hypothetical protein